MPGAEGLRLPPGEGRDGRQRAAEPGPGQGHGILAALPEALGSLLHALLAAAYRPTVAHN